MQIGHRDLKSHNILVRRVHETTEYVLEEISDFGVSKVKELSMIDFTPNTGTLRWKAPELIKPSGARCLVKEPFQEVFPKVAKCDTYSFAIVCYEILMGSQPFLDMETTEFKAKVLDGKRPNLPDRCPKRLKNLIERCWSHNASKRPCYGEICKELWYLKYELLMTYTWGKDTALALGYWRSFRINSRL
ncbi:hypothetical protein KC19_7G109000 [Ceratodon purpureus]|uniref:Protein kinase domain-containing protein n=1 Tax=Ceratodon purpureus TaxID=3225 RepID=A0A8T0HA89_CERPU|nr:hypothetical protein KC19_7G109000 [Ceratodon purpureus]